MNPREAIEFVIDASNRRDFDAIERSGVMHAEMEFHSVVARAEGSVYRGVDGLRAWGRMADDMWDEFRIELIDVQTGTDCALVHLRLTGVARGSGVPLDQLATQVWRWREGLLWRNVAYSDHIEAARAAGL